MHQVLVRPAGSVPLCDGLRTPSDCVRLTEAVVLIRTIVKCNVFLFQHGVPSDPPRITNVLYIVVNVAVTHVGDRISHAVIIGFAKALDCAS